MVSKLEMVLQKLWQRSRFTSYFYQFVQVVPEKNIPTLALYSSTYRLHLLYNIDFIQEIQTEELIGLLVHEMMHVILNHDHRRHQNQDPVIQNLAQDMVINSYLTDHQKTFFSRSDKGERDIPCLIMPPGLPKIPKAFFEVHPTKKKDQITWEILYRWLIKKQKKQDMEKTDDTGSPLENYSVNTLALSGHGLDEQMEMIQEGISFHDQASRVLPTGVHFFRNNDYQTSIEALKNRIINYAKQDETCHNERFFQHISTMIQKIQKVDKITWQSAIKSFVDSRAMSQEWEYSTNKFDRRYFASGMYAPGRAYNKSKILTVAVDVSGSMVTNPQDLELAFGLIETLLKQYKVYLL